MKRILIIGGGYAGTQLARALDAFAEVVLIEPKEAFVHNVAAIRAVVDPAWLDRLILPYDRLLKRGRVLRDRVVAIDPAGVSLAANGALDGDIVVVAAGSTYAQPFKATNDSIADFRAALLEAHGKLKAARSVAIVGAGAVGVELAGEIAVGDARQSDRSRLRDAGVVPRFHARARSAIARRTLGAGNRRSSRRKGGRGTKGSQPRHQASSKSLSRRSRPIWSFPRSERNLIAPCCAGSRALLSILWDASRSMDGCGLQVRKTSSPSAMWRRAVTS